MTYKEFIDNIIATRGRHGCGDEYHEKHHIIPKCLGGEDKEENYVDLFAKEHYEAHRLLALENPNNYKLQYAWWNMCEIKGNREQNRYVPTAEEYEKARIACSIISSKRVKGKNHPMYGRHHTKETKEKMSKSHKGKSDGDKNPMYGKHHTDEWKKNNSAMMKKIHATRRHPMAKYVYCDGKIFNSIKECAKYYNITIDRMKKWLERKTKIPEEFKKMGLRKIEDM